LTYYKILQYCKKHGLTDGQAHYVRNMIRELINEQHSVKSLKEWMPK